MSGLAIGLVALSAVVHAAWNAAVKRHPDPAGAAVVVVVGACAGAAILAAVGGEGVPPRASWAWVLASGVVEGAYFVTLARALARLPLGTAYGLSRGGGQLVTWPVSVLALGEPATATALAGAAVLVGGLAARVRPPFDRGGLLWAGLCAITIGAYPLTYQAALRTGAAPFGLFAASLLLSLPVQLVALGPTAPDRLRAAARGRLPGLFLAAIACAASFLLFLAALRTDGAGRASAVRNLSIAVAVALGIAQGEQADRRALLGAAAITLGAALVSFG